LRSSGSEMSSVVFIAISTGYMIWVATWWPASTEGWKAHAWPVRA
jgi:hypothetical protein